MKISERINYITVLRVVSTSGVLMFLSGCIIAIPPGLQLASMALDGVSYMATGKTIADHALSGLISQDCAMIRILQDNEICHAPATDLEVAVLPEGSPAGQIPQAPHNADNTYKQSQFDDIDMEVAGGPLL
ncbi:MAG: hypothetical protein JKY17_09455 [Magnetovibrio sp.]|nr:hypothetical protein [Magnetovibrio sp.]